MSFKMLFVTYMQIILNCTIVLKGASDPDSLIKNLEREVSNVSHCLSINKMTINTKKSWERDCQAFGYCTRKKRKEKKNCRLMHWPKIQHHLKNITAKDIPRLLYDMHTSRSRYTLKLTENQKWRGAKKHVYDRDMEDDGCFCSFYQW